MTAPPPIDGFDELEPDAAAALVRPVCASPQWVSTILDGRPHGALDRLIAASSAAIDALPWSEVELALDAHPRIGQRAGGADVESAWSRQEQSAAAAEPSATRALHDGNVEYEARFGHVFLICATGRSAPEILAALTARLGNDATTEQGVVRAELAAIAALRLTKLFEGDSP